jgi:hypothetical protein
MMTSMRATSVSSQLEVREARDFRMRQITIDGTPMSPINPPRTANVYQSHGAPVSASAAQPLAYPTNFASNTEIMAHAIIPLTAVMQPTPR